MKTIGHSTVLAGICASAMCLTSAYAQQQQPGQVVVPPNTVGVPPEQYTWSQNSKFYMGADAGGLLTGDTRVKEFFGPVGPGTKVKLDPGARFGVNFGYKITDWFSVEGETGLNINSIKSITGADINGDANLSNIPFLGNVRLQIPHGKFPVTPYIGGGAGVSASVIGIQHHIELNGVDVHGSDADAVWAYQAFAGLRYAINDHMGIGVEYHYFATTGPTWTADSQGTASDRMKFLGVQSHAISVAFDVNF
ncbi:MAG TPA: outer membrane beta-barrel protein [Candidatus Polarisedimenticolia bacterium]|nr:outer membrane beta-barrel protein [Candidatus Polarisedimenticolia bacterium]